MLDADLHVHSHFSKCGLHSYLELLTRARENGMSAVAITDHGPALKGRLSHVFFDRLVDPVAGVKLLKGVECNLGSEPGTIDAPVRLMPLCDIILLGIHPNTPEGLGEKGYTDLLLAAMEHNECIDIITHCNSTEFPVDFDSITRAAADLDIAIELNNSKVALGRVPLEVTTALLLACAANKCLVAVNSDTHAINELGDDSAIRPLMNEAGIGDEYIVNRDSASAVAWLRGRKERKVRWVENARKVG